MDTDIDDPAEPPRERIFNAPWLSVVVAGSILALYLLQSRQPDELALVYRFGLVPADLSEGRYGGLLTHMLLHGNWAHAGLNAIGALAFGAAVARLLDRPVLGSVGFLLFYIACGVAAGLTYSLLHPDSAGPLIGASGAVFGLIGAAMRLLGTGGRLGPVLDRRVLLILSAWVGVNLLIGIVGFAPGSGGVAVAWEAHIAGLVAGALLIGPWSSLFARPSAI